jgi:hypothetical protein
VIILFIFHCFTHGLVSTVTSPIAVVWQRLPMAAVLLPLGSRYTRSHSSASNSNGHNDRAPAVHLFTTNSTRYLHLTPRLVATSHQSPSLLHWTMTRRRYVTDSECLAVSNWTFPTESQSQITTDGQSASSSWCQAHVWRSWSIFFKLSLDNCKFANMGEPSPTRGCACNLQFSRARVLRDSLLYFTLSNLGPSNLESQVPVLISLRNRVAQLYPRHRTELVQ